MSSSIPGAAPRKFTATRFAVLLSTALSGGLGYAPTLLAQTAPVDLRVGIDESADPVIAGAGLGNLVYNIVVENSVASAEAATNVLVESNLTTPAGVSVTLNPVDGFIDPDTGLWHIPFLPQGQDANLSVIMNVGASAPAGAGLISETVTVTGADQDLEPSENTATETTDIRREVDLVVTKIESTDPVIAGGNDLIYTVNVHNAGPSDASEVTVHEDLLLPATPYITAVFDPAIVPPVWDIGDLPAGTGATLVVDVRVSSSAAPGVDAISDTASVAGINPNEVLINPGDDSATQTTSIERRVELVLTKTDSVDPIVAGTAEEPLVYQVALHNLGPSDATHINVLETPDLPAGVEILDVTAGSGGFWGYPDWLIPVLPAGAKAYLTMTLGVGPGAKASIHGITNTATVTAVDEPLIGDPEARTATETTAIAPPDPTPTPALGIWTLGLLIAGLAGAGAYFHRRRSRSNRPTPNA